MEQGTQKTYFLLPSTVLRTLAWLVSVVAVLVLYALYTINSQTSDFKNDAIKAVSHVHEQLLINDAALSGFASLLTSVGPNNLQQTRDFTQRMRNAYPHIYMFEALVSVAPENKAEHETRMHAAGYPDYKLTRYVSKKNPSGKTFNLIEETPMHFPIFFIDPMSDAVKGLMGFDMLSARTMREPLLATIASGEPAASKPYKLREGGRGYVLIKAIDTASDTGAAYPENGLAALLLVKTDAMLAGAAALIPSAQVSLLYGDARKLAAEEIYPQVDELPLIDLKELITERHLDDLGQPFTLSVKQAVGLYQRHIEMMAVLSLLMMAGYFFYYRSQFAKYRLQIQRDEAVVELAQQHSQLEVIVAKRTEELQRKMDENKRLAQQLIRVQEDQYHHIARELHDEFGQILTAIKINAHILENSVSIEGVKLYAEEIDSQADSLYETMRDMIQRLRPEALDMFGLKVALEQCILAFHLGEQGIDLELNIDESVNDVEEIYTIASYRIVQELVNNAVKYAGLSKLTVSLAVTDGNMCIDVADNGVGFDPLVNKAGFGLSGVDERARSLGGYSEISTSVGGGVKVYVRIPLQDS